MIRFGTCLLLLSVIVSGAQGELLTISSSIALAEPIGADVVLNDCFVDTDGAIWLHGAFVCDLDAGDLYQTPSYWGELQWMYPPGPPFPVDSYMAPGISLFSDADDVAIDPFGLDPANLEVSMTFAADLVSAQVPPWDGIAARFAFTEDAEGVWGFKLVTKGSDPVYYSGIVQNGFMIIPEPSLLALLATAVGMIFWRRP